MFPDVINIKFSVTVDPYLRRKDADDEVVSTIKVMKSICYILLLTF